MNELSSEQTLKIILPVSKLLQSSLAYRVWGKSK